jgi:hypothetical protein
MFVIARITTLDIEVGIDVNIFDVPDGVQEFFNTGLLGALITSVVTSLAWRVIASAFPFEFLSNPLVYFMIRFCLLLETIILLKDSGNAALLSTQIFDGIGGGFIGLIHPYSVADITFGTGRFNVLSKYFICCCMAK